MSVHLAPWLPDLCQAPIPTWMRKQIGRPGLDPAILWGMISCHIRCFDRECEEALVPIALRWLLMTLMLQYM